MPMAKRKAGNGGRKESGKVRKKGENSSPNGSGKKSKSGGRDRKTGPRLPMALRKHIDLISSKREYEKEEEERSDGDEVLSDDDDVEVNNLYEYVAQKPQEELQMNRRFDPVEKVKMGLPEDFEDEDVPSDDEMVNGVSDDNDGVFNGIVFGKEDDSDDEEDDEERHARMLNRVTNMPTTMFKGERKKNDVIISEVHPESEYNPTRDILEGDAAVTLEDLIGGFGNKSEYSKIRNRIKEMEKKSVSVHAPLPKPDKDKLERKVAYEHLKKEITKMESVVKRNREASTLYFDDNTNLGFSTVGAITCGFKPQSEFEKKMASIVHDARLDEAHRKDGSRLLELNKVSIEDERERQNRLAKMRSLLFKHEVKAKHIKKIKSKTYHRLNKKGKLKTLGDLHMDPESAKEQATKQEYKRAEERMTLKHKNTAKWAKRNLKRGLAIQDEGTRAAIAEQLHKHEILTRKMKSMNSDSSSADDEEDESSDGSDKEGVSEAKLLEKAKQRIHKVLEEDDGPPNSGVLSLPFMVRGLKKQQEAANEEARLALQDFEKSSNTEGAESTLIPVTNGRRVFGNAKKESQPSKRRAKPEVEYHSSDSEYEIETKDIVDSEHLDKPKDVNIDAAFFHEETDNNATSVFKNFKDIAKDPGPKTAFEVSILASKPVKKVKNNKDLIVADPTEQHQENVKLPSDNDGNLSAQKSRKTVKFDLPEHGTEEVDEDNDTDSEGQMIEGTLSSGTKSAYILPSQAELIRDAFAGDDVVDEFAKAKQEVLNEENPEPEEPKLVPGWGDWTQTQKRRGLPPWMVKEHEDAKKKREESIKKRKDSHLKHVIMSEKVDKKAEKLYTKTLPYPHTSVGFYEQSIRMPLGPEFNPASAASELTRRDVMKRSGLIIQPLQYDDAIPYEKVEDSGHKPHNKTKSGKTSSVKPNSKRR